MLDAAIELVPKKHRLDILYVALALVVFTAGYATNYFKRATVIQRTRVVHVKQSYGTPDQSVAGAQVNPALNGLTCDVYNSRHVIVCHP